MFPSTIRDGCVGIDPEYRFSEPNASRCANGPLPREQPLGVITLSLDGGMSWFDPIPNETGYQADHSYSYHVIGQGGVLGMEHFDVFTSDNYGVLQVEIELDSNSDAMVYDTVEVCSQVLFDSLERLLDTIGAPTPCNQSVKMVYQLVLDTSELVEVSRCPNEVVYPMLPAGEHFVVITTEDGCDSVAHIRLIDQFGPADTSYMVRRQSDFAAYLPTAYSPNNDGVNDCFGPLFGATVVDYDLKVYDRWGGLVFDNGGARVGWCGAIGEQADAEGMYVYVIGFGSEDCIYEWRTGSVLLVR